MIHKMQMLLKQGALADLIAQQNRRLIQPTVVWQLVMFTQWCIVVYLTFKLMPIVFCYMVGFTYLCLSDYDVCFYHFH